MQSWDIVINTAMMGTDKKQMGTMDLPEGLVEALALINENKAKDKEEKFLQLASLVFNYRQCGSLPVQKEIMIPAAPVEEKQYCNKVAGQVLNDIISEQNIPLLKWWLQHCHEKQQIVKPEIIPLLLSIGVQQKKLQSLIAGCCGKRGEWLSRFNPEWNFSITQEDEEWWHTGTLEQRKELFKQKRKTDPAKAREWLQQTWSQEDANTKTNLLELLSENISEGDIPFLESLSTEKSKKVKDAALELLKRIPGSQIIRQYEDVLKQSISIKKEKALLGMVSKYVLEFNLPASLPDEIFKSGIEKLSNQKNITDESFILYQLIGFTPPEFWESHLNCSPAEVIELFKKTEEARQKLPALGLAVGRFKVSGWARLFLSGEKSFYPELIPLLDKKERENYLLQFIHVDNMTNTVIELATQEEEGWGIDLARAIFRHAAKNPYHYNKSFYNQHINLIPVHIVGELEKYTPAEESLRAMWSNTSEYVIKLITLKIQTIKAFNS